MPADVTELDRTRSTCRSRPRPTASGIGDTGFHRACWYRARIRPDAGRRPRTILHFGAVDYSATGVGQRPAGGRARGRPHAVPADITRRLKADGRQIVTVSVPRTTRPTWPSRAASRTGCSSRTRSGIRAPPASGRPCGWSRSPRTYIQPLRWTPIFEDFEIGCEVFAGRRHPGRPVRRGQDLARRHSCWRTTTTSCSVGEANRKIALSDPGIDDSRNELLWSPERPTLLDAEVTLRYGDRVLDRVRSYTALRSVAINRDRFMLNGRPYPLRLVLDQGYWPETLMTAPSDEALRDVELAKAMGFNGVRKHQKIEDPRYLYWADKLGLLVWEEMPSAYRFTPKRSRAWCSEWTEAIERDYSHPCIIVWVPFNESWGVPNLTLDPGAPQRGRGAVPPDAHARRDPSGDRQRRLGSLGHRHPRHPRLRLRSGAVTDALCDDGPVQHAVRPAPSRRAHPDAGRLPAPRPADRADRIRRHRVRSKAKDTDAHLGLYPCPYGREPAHRCTERLLEVVNTRDMFSGFCYTQFADTFQEANGLLNADRTPKLPLEVISAATRNVPVENVGKPRAQKPA